jgi:hypothetical protein
MRHFTPLAITNALQGLISILQVLLEHIEGLLLMDEDDSLFTPPPFQASSAYVQDTFTPHALDSLLTHAFVDLYKKQYVLTLLRCLPSTIYLSVS